MLVQLPEPPPGGRYTLDMFTFDPADPWFKKHFVGPQGIIDPDTFQVVRDLWLQHAAQADTPLWLVFHLDRRGFLTGSMMLPEPASVPELPDPETLHRLVEGLFIAVEDACETPGCAGHLAAERLTRQSRPYEPPRQAPPARPRLRLLRGGKAA